MRYLSPRHHVDTQHMLPQYLTSLPDITYGARRGIAYKTWGDENGDRISPSSPSCSHHTLAQYRTPQGTWVAPYASSVQYTGSTIR
eukprot:3465139-Rhodomonas_salina.1